MKKKLEMTEDKFEMKKLKMTKERSKWRIEEKVKDD
jgi:hypothetical protein